jgi:endoglucanase
MVTVYAANINGLSTFKMPDDDNLIFSFHTYDPYLFTITANAQKTWSSEKAADTSDITRVFDTVNKQFVSKGIPAICGEFGALMYTTTPKADRLDYTDFVLKTAESEDIPCILWIDSDGVIDRSTSKWQQPDLLKVLQEYMD